VAPFLRWGGPVAVLKSASSSLNFR
jgi:hypothetical protein